MSNIDLGVASRDNAYAGLHKHDGSRRKGGGRGPHDADIHRPAAQWGPLGARDDDPANVAGVGEVEAGCSGIHHCQEVQGNRGGDVDGEGNEDGEGDEVGEGEDIGEGQILY